MNLQMGGWLGRGFGGCEGQGIGVGRRGVRDRLLAMRFDNDDLSGGENLLPISREITQTTVERGTEGSGRKVWHLCIPQGTYVKTYSRKSR